MFPLHYNLRGTYGQEENCNIKIILPILLFIDIVKCSNRLLIKIAYSNGAVFGGNYLDRERYVMDEIFKNVDCIELYVSDLDDGIKYYCESMGLKLLWRTDTSVGLGMENDIAEIVLQTDRPFMSVDLKVESVAASIDKIIEAGGKVLDGPFEIPIGKCAVICDKWDNKYVILDMTKGRYTTDEHGYVTGVSKDT